MKRKLLLLAVVGSLGCSYAQAQIKKGSVLLGGSLGFSRIETNQVYTQVGNFKTIQKSLTVSPSLGIAIQDNLILGGDLTFDTRKQTYNKPFQLPQRTNFYGAGVFLRKYWKVADKLYLFGDGRLGYSFSNEKLPSTRDPQLFEQRKTNSVSLSIYPGLSFAVSRRVHIETTFFNLLTASYKNETLKEKESGKKLNTKNDFDLASSFNNSNTFTAGVKFLLSR